MSCAHVVILNIVSGGDEREGKMLGGVGVAYSYREHECVRWSGLPRLLS